MVVDPTLPYRFKANPSTARPTMTEPFHHRRSGNLSHKAFKTRHASKSALKELAKGKTANTLRDGGKIPGRKSSHQQVMSKIDRRHHARQMMHQKAQQHAKANSIFAGVNGAPRIVAMLALSDNVDLPRAVQKLNQAVGVETPADFTSAKYVRNRIDRFKQNLIYVLIERGDLFSALNACRSADFVVMIMSAKDEELPSAEDETTIRAVESQGISTMFSLVQDLNAVEGVKKRTQVTYALKTWITRFFPQHDKILSLDTDSECVNAVRSICTTIPKGIHWREERSWMLAEDVTWSHGNEDELQSIVVTGVVRGKGLKANRLVQLGDWGTFQISKILDASHAISSRKRNIEGDTCSASSDEKVLELPDEAQETTDRLAPLEASMEDASVYQVSEAISERKGVLIDDHHYFSEDEKELSEFQRPKKLPKGTSNYQAAWYLGDMSDSGSDYEDVLDEEGDVPMEVAARPEDGLEGLDQTHQVDPTEGGTEYPASEMFLDPSPAQEASAIENYRASRKMEAAEDLEFPDEIELAPNVLARERLSKYRGLKSLKTSVWDTNEDRLHQPEDWPRLLQVPDFRRAKKHSLSEALVGGASPGTRVAIEVRNVPKHHRTQTQPLSIFSHLAHEQKNTVMNISITLPSTATRPLRAKDALIVQYGSRRFLIKPLFSLAGNTPNDVHKFVRYLHPGQTAIATFIGPVTWSSTPAIFFAPAPTMNTEVAHALTPATLVPIASGTTAIPSTSRVVAKRIILTGHPYKINRKVVTLRYMFFNKEDVHWFKALQLWTRRGRSGYIKDSLGTHGYFKATFDGKVNPQDSVGVSLYKRVWPREGVAWSPSDEAEEGGRGDDSMQI